MGPTKRLSLADIKDTERSLFDLLVDLSETLIDDPATAEDNEFNRHGALAVINLCELTTELAAMRKVLEPDAEDACALPEADSKAEALHTATHGEYCYAVMGIGDVDAE